MNTTKVYSELRDMDLRMNCLRDGLLKFENELQSGPRISKHELSFIPDLLKQTQWISRGITVLLDEVGTLDRYTQLKLDFDEEDNPF